MLSTINTKEKSPEGVANQTDVLAPSQILTSVSLHQSSGQLVIMASGHGHPNEFMWGHLVNPQFSASHIPIPILTKLHWQSKKLFHGLALTD